MGQRRIPPVPKAEGDFLESKLPIKAIATLTVPGCPSRFRLDSSFSEWIRALQAHNRETLGWIKSIESDPRRHMHAALIAASPLDCVHAAELWQTMIAPRYSEAAIVKLHRDGLYGIGYVLKLLDSTAEDIQFSDNITFFADGNRKSLFHTNSATKRQRRRIKAQFEQGSGHLSH